MDYPARIMVVGNGGRECAIANAILLSERIERLLITPPNWGVLDPHGPGRVAALHITATDSDALVQTAVREGVQLCVIGPEAPLVAGLGDDMRRAGVPVLGPGLNAARLEGSKSFAKHFLIEHGIPTAQYAEFTDPHALRRYLDVHQPPLVLKADGLAAGKGVIVCHTRAEVDEAYARLIEKREFGSAAEVVIVEELLEGPEISFTCVIATGAETGCHGVLLQASSDYKRLQDGDAGPNTGGMGNICPSPWATEEVLREFHREIFDKVLGGLVTEHLEYRGFLFIGTMLTPDGLQVLEFNTRLGDPEAQVVLPLTPLSDWAAALGMVAQGAMPPITYVRRYAACVAVVLASGNYPYGKSAPARIEGLSRVAARGLHRPQHEDGSALLPAPVSIYFAGVEREPAGAIDASPAAAASRGEAMLRPEREDARRATHGIAPTQSAPYQNYTDTLGQWDYLASGGRVLAVSALGRDLSDARRLAYEVVGNLHFEGMQLRSDIGKLR